MCKNFENWSSNRNFCLPYKKIQKQVNKNQEIHFFGHFWIDTRFHLLYQPLDTPNFFQGFEILTFLSCKNIIFFLQGVSKKCKNRICLISREPRNRFLNRFFLLKTEIHMKILNTEPILCDIRGLRYLQTKMGLWNGHNHIGNDLKWSQQCQIGLKMSFWPLPGPLNSLN